MTSKEMFGNALWLETSEKIDVPHIRGEFSAASPVQHAEITISGLGMFALYINGNRVGDDLYGTLASDFHETEHAYCTSEYGEHLGHRIYAKQLDITDLVAEQNCIGITLAPGWYRNKENNYGSPKLCFRIMLTDANGQTAEILSGDWLHWTQSEIVSWDFYHGEHHDYSAIHLDGWMLPGYDASAWHPMVAVAAPESSYLLSDCPPDRIIRCITPKLIAETDTEFLYDMGENITGTPVLEQRTGGSCKMTLRVSERLEAGRRIEAYTNHGQNASFVTDGRKRQYRLRFCWFGFRYAAVSKNARIVSCEVSHADVPVSSSFRSSNPLLNWMYETYLRTQLDNMHCGIPSDCPHIEKRGYTGDGELVCECAMMMLDAKSFYKKWLGDIADCQDRVSGHIQYTAPYVRSGGGPGGWGCAIAEVPYIYYKMYGDESVLADFLPQVLRYFDYLEAHSENDLVVSDQKNEWCLGDWCTPEEIVIPEPFVNNYFYIRTINRLLEFCRVLNRNDLVPELTALAERKKAAIVRTYFDAQTGDFCRNVQGANAFAVDLGLGDDRTFANMVRHYEQNTWFDTGIFGTDIVTRVLFERGHATLAYRLLTSEEKYSFWHWQSTGCTTFPEYWTYNRSQNHPMFGAVIKYLFRFILGITQEGAGWKNIVIAPKFADGLNSAEGSILTESGRVSVRFVRSAGRVSFRIEIPEGVQARLAYAGSHPLTAGVHEFSLPEETTAR